jgi:hypothetical protein
MHGRRTLAIIATLDFVVFSYMLLVLLLTLDRLDFYDTLLIGGHWLHSITWPLGFIIVRRATPVHKLLRMLSVLYVIAFVCDALTVVARLFLLTNIVAHEHTASAPVAGAVRCALGIMFCGIDAVGAFFGDFGYQYALLPTYSDSQMVATAARIATTPSMYTEYSAGPTLAPRIISVHNQQSSAQQQQK